MPARMRFRLGKIPVTVQWSFFLVGVLLSADRLSKPATLVSWLAVVFVSVLFHELGHAVAFIRFGHTPSIELYQMGGVTRGTRGVPTTAGRDTLIALAGPCAGFMLGGLSYWLSPVIAKGLPAIGPTIASDLVWVNIGWGALNLLPIWPLDGGLALSGALRVVTPRRGELFALITSCIFTAGAVIAALSFKMYWAAFIAAWFGSGGFTRLRHVWARGGDGLTDHKLREAYAHLREDRADQALAVAQELLASTTNRQVRRDAAQLLASAHLALRDPKSALAALEAEPDPPDPVLHAVVLSQIENRAPEAIEALRRAYQLRRDAPIGHALATTLLRVGDLDGAQSMIEDPRGAELPDPTHAAVEAALFHAGRFDHALALSKIRFRRFGVANAAYNAACSEIRLHHLDAALDWLKRAVATGPVDLQKMATDEDLAPLRARPEFRALLSSPATAQ